MKCKYKHYASNSPLCRTYAKSSTIAYEIKFWNCFGIIHKHRRIEGIFRDPFRSIFCSRRNGLFLLLVATLVEANSRWICRWSTNAQHFGQYCGMHRCVAGSIIHTRTHAFSCRSSKSGVRGGTARNCVLAVCSLKYFWWFTVRLRCVSKDAMAIFGDDIHLNILLVCVNMLSALCICFTQVAHEKVMTGKGFKSSSSIKCCNWCDAGE